MGAFSIYDILKYCYVHVVKSCHVVNIMSHFGLALSVTVGLLYRHIQLTCSVVIILTIVLDIELMSLDVLVLHYGTSCTTVTNHCKVSS